MGDLAKFDPSALIDGVSARIRETFVSLIPEEAWKALVQKEINVFFQEYSDRSSSTYRNTSDFQKLVFAEIEVRTKETIKKVIDEYIEGGNWVGCERIAGERIKNMIVENSGTILASVIGRHIDDFLQQLRNNLGVTKF